MNYQNFISFDIYLLLIICFLSIACYFISFDLLISISGNWNLYKWRYVNIMECINSSNIFSIAKVYIIRKEWLSCILMLELALLEHKLHEPSIEYYSCLAFCFYKLKSFNKAERYYLLYLDFHPNHINSLTCLANIYSLSEQHIQAKMIYNRILYIDPKNKKAQEYFNLSSY